MDQTDENELEEEAYAYCKDCLWASTPGSHHHSGVLVDADVHATFNAGHTTTAGFSSTIAFIARRRTVVSDE